MAGQREAQDFVTHQGRHLGHPSMAEEPGGGDIARLTRVMSVPEAMAKPIRFLF
ncbi:hypothetical protein [Streptomyces sp. NPDC002853]